MRQLPQTDLVLAVEQGCRGFKQSPLATGPRLVEDLVEGNAPLREVHVPPDPLVAG